MSKQTERYDALGVRVDGPSFFEAKTKDTGQPQAWSEDEQAVAVIVESEPRYSTGTIQIMDNSGPPGSTPKWVAVFHREALELLLEAARAES